MIIDELQKSNGKKQEMFICPDPFVFRWKNKYYCYCSGEGGVKVRCSKDLRMFTDCGYAYSSGEEHSYWGPCIIEIRGTFYMYYSSLLKGESDDHKHFLKVVTSNDPLGPFEECVILKKEFCIDPHVVIKNDKMLIFYAANIEENPINGRIGTTIWMDELKTPVELLETGHPVLYPSIDREIFKRNRFGDGKDWHTLEGPFYLSDGESGWLMYSGNAYTSSNYFINYAWEDQTDNKYYKSPFATDGKPFVSASKLVKGPGHNSITQAPDHITPIIVYHGRMDIGVNDDEDRVLFMDRIWREGKILKSNAPTGNESPNFPKPNIELLNESYFKRRKNNEEGVTMIDCDYEYKLPAKESFYIEGCFKSTVNKSQLIITNNVGEEKKIEIEEGDYWQRIGVMFFDNWIKIKKGEEWLEEKNYIIPESIKLISEGRLDIIYLDYTILETICGDIPHCLL